jgi:hypothetical protein
MKAKLFFSHPVHFSQRKKGRKKKKKGKHAREQGTGKQATPEFFIFYWNST